VEKRPSKLERLVFFSDAVFAIAITLLVLPLTEADLEDEHLASQLLALWPELLSFALSFLVVGTYWIAHHRMFDHIVRLDVRMLWINLVFLACIAFLPFPTAVLGRHGDTTAAVVLYAAAMSVTGFASAGLWLYASGRHRLIDPDLDPRLVRLLTLRALVVPTAFLPSIVVAFFSPPVAWVLWFIAYPITVVVRRLSGALEEPHR
jgi:uncharacterized membrane protein